MRLQDLVPYHGLNLVVHDDLSGNTLVLTSAGAVYSNENTDDLTNMEIAFGAIVTSNKWRIATTAEVNKMRNSPEPRMLVLTWCNPDPSPSHLTLV